MPGNGHGAARLVLAGGLLFPVSKKAYHSMNNQTKTCVHCRSEINALATKCPHCQSDVRTPWAKHKLWVILFGSIVLVMIVSAISSSSNTPAPVAPVAPTPVKTVVQNPSFDIPALVGKNIDQITQVLGKPDKEYVPTAAQKDLGVTEGDKTYIKDGNTLLITYTVNNRKVVDFFISTTDQSGATSDITNMLKVGNLSQSDPKYTIEPVKSLKNAGSFTGIKIIAK